MIQSKMFVGSDPQKLEGEVNQWLAQFKELEIVSTMQSSVEKVKPALSPPGPITPSIITHITILYEMPG